MPRYFANLVRSGTQVLAGPRRPVFTAPLRGATPKPNKRIEDTGEASEATVQRRAGQRLGPATSFVSQAPRMEPGERVPLDPGEKGRATQRAAETSREEKSTRSERTAFSDARTPRPRESLTTEPAIGPRSSRSFGRVPPASQEEQKTPDQEIRAERDSAAGQEQASAPAGIRETLPRPPRIEFTASQENTTVHIGASTQTPIPPLKRRPRVMTDLTTKAELESDQPDVRKDARPRSDHSLAARTTEDRAKVNEAGERPALPIRQRNTQH